MPTAMFTRSITLHTQKMDSTKNWSDSATGAQPRGGEQGALHPEAAPGGPCGLQEGASYDSHRRGYCLYHIVSHVVAIASLVVVFSLDIWFRIQVVQETAHSLWKNMLLRDPETGQTLETVRMPSTMQGALSPYQPEVFNMWGLLLRSPGCLGELLRAWGPSSTQQRFYRLAGACKFQAVRLWGV